MDTELSEPERAQQYFSLIGNYALLWGSFEATVRRAIPRIEASSEGVAFGDKLLDRLPKLNEKQFARLLSELETAAQKGFGKIPDDCKSFLGDAEKIKDFRNLIMHNYYYMDEGVLYKAPKPRKG